MKKAGKAKKTLEGEDRTENDVERLRVEVVWRARVEGAEKGGKV